MSNILVGKGDVDLAVYHEGAGKFSFVFLPEHDGRWREWQERGYQKIALTVLYDYYAELPACSECDNFKECKEYEESWHDTEDEITAGFEQSRLECVSVNTDKLLADISKFKTKEKLKAFLRGEE